MQKKKKKIVKMPTGDMDKDIEIIKEVSLSTLLKSGGLDPTLYIMNKDYAHIIHGPGLPASAEERQKLFGKIGAEMAERMPDAYGFVVVMEAWSSVAQAGDMNEDGTIPADKMPSKQPNRTETLIISAIKANGDQKVMFNPFVHEGSKIKMIKLSKQLKELDEFGWVKYNKPNDDDVQLKDNILGELWRAYKLAPLLKNSA